MVRLPNFAIDRAEEIVRNSRFYQVFQTEYGANNPGRYYRMDQAFILLNMDLKEHCPFIKWRRKYADQIARNAPENTRVYQRASRPLFIRDDDF